MSDDQDTPTPPPPWGKDPFSDTSAPSPEPSEATRRKHRAQPSMLFVGFLSASLGAALAFAGLWFFSNAGRNAPATTSTTVAATATADPSPPVTIPTVGRDPLVTVTNGATTVGGIAVSDGGHFAIPATEQVTEFAVTTVDGRTCAASLVGTDQTSGVTIVSCPELRITGMIPSTATDTWLTTDATIRSQEPIAAIAVDQRFVNSQGDRIFGLIELDAAVPAGTAIVDADGSVVALVLDDLYRNNSATPGSELSVVTAALPASLLQRIADDIIADGHASYGGLGVEVIDWVRPGSLEADGALVLSVIDQQGLLLVGDIILSIEGRPVLSADGLVSLLRFYRGGETISISVSRASTEVDLEVALGELSEHNP